MGEETRSCPECDAQNAADAKFCSQCATPLVTTQAQEIEALEAAAAAETEQPTAEQPTAEVHGEGEPHRTETAENDEPAVTPVAAAQPGTLTVTRKKALVGGGVLVALIVGIAVALAVSLSGGAAKPKPQRAAATQPAQTAPVNTEDTDGDGIPDANDSDPYAAADTADDSSTDEFDNAPDETDDSFLDDADEETAHTAVSVGEPATDDDVTFKVLSLEPVSSLPTDEFSDGPITPKKGAKLVKAVVTWKNNTSKSESIFCGGGSAILLDQNARNFDPIDDQIDIANNGLCDDVQPGFKQTVTLAFQMPKDSNTTELVLWNDAAEDDFDGSQSDVRVTK
jgi:hypothetical protein